MAQTYTFLGNDPTIKTFGTEIVQPGERWTWEAHPSGITFSLVFAPIPPPQGGASIWTDTAINDQRNLWGDLLAGLLALPGVTTVSQLQEIDDANQLKDYVQVTVRSSSGQSVRAVRFEMGSVLFPGHKDVEIAAVRASLDAAEASGGSVVAAPVEG